MSFTIRNYLLAEIERGGSYQSKIQHLKKRIISWEKDNLLEKASINDSMYQTFVWEKYHLPSDVAGGYIHAFLHEDMQVLYGNIPYMDDIQGNSDIKIILT